MGADAHRVIVVIGHFDIRPNLHRIEGCAAWLHRTRWHFINRVLARDIVAHYVADHDDATSPRLFLGATP